MFCHAQALPAFTLVDGSKGQGPVRRQQANKAHTKPIRWRAAPVSASHWMAKPKKVLSTVWAMLSA